MHIARILHAACASAHKQIDGKEKEEEEERNACTNTSFAIFSSEIVTGDAAASAMVAGACCFCLIHDPP